jgi:hypothetical protein
MQYNDIDNNEINKVKQGLTELGNALEVIANRVVPVQRIEDRQLTGNAIQGGKITQFRSTGITDSANKTILLVDNNGITVDTVNTDTIDGDVTVTGALTVAGHLECKSLHVDELTADIRQQRSDSLMFDSSNGDSPIGKGLVWQGEGTIKSFILQTNPSRLYSSEPIDLHREASYQIDNVTVLTADTLGETITKSSLRKVGRLQGLTVDGDVNIDDFVFWDGGAMRLSIGTEAPNGQLSISSEVAEFIVDPIHESVKLGTYSTSELQVITDNTPRITISPYGHVTIGQQSNSDTKVSVFGKVGFGVSNPSSNFEVAGPIKFEGKKFGRGSAAPTTGLWSKGDIIWNNEPVPSGWIGWICVREGTPGEWKPFGHIEG